MYSINEKRRSLKKYDDKNKNISINSKISYILGILTIIVQFYLGFTHIGDSDPASRQFVTLNFMEGTFVIIGLFLPDIIRGLKPSLYPKNNFRPITFMTFIVLITTLTLNMLIQTISQVALSIRNVEMAFAILFSAPAEELFFRAFLGETFAKLSRSSGLKDIQITKKRSIGHIEIMGFIMSAILFTLLHVNYYGDIRLLFVVFFGGLIYSVAYWATKDITGCMLAHFALNAIATWQIFFNLLL